MMIQGHGGNIYELAKELRCSPGDIHDMSSNVNPLGPPPNLPAYLRDHIDVINALPEVDASGIVSDFSRRYDLDPAAVIAANGTTQFIYTLPPALGITKACILAPTYADYADACAMHSVDHHLITVEEADGFQPNIDTISKNANDVDIVFICNPNNPTGVLIESDRLIHLLGKNPRTVFVIDESYLPFCDDADKHTMIRFCEKYTNLIVLNSMSKIFRVPGLRIGFLISSEKIIQQLTRYALPWNVNSLAQKAVSYLMTRTAEIDDFIAETRQFLNAEKQFFGDALKNSDLIQLYPSETSFLLARLHRHTSESMWRKLADHRILIRDCSNFNGLSNRYIRISLKTEPVNRMLIEKLKEM